MDKQSQNVKILAYMRENGSITPKQAEDLFTCMRLASRINDLRKHHNIITEIVRYTDKDGDRRSYARYYLAD